MKNKILILMSFCLCFALSSCSNGNLFSWAHDSGSGDYASLMSDGDTAMKDHEYKKAEKYYQKAMKKKPNDNEAIYGYCSAVFAGAIEPIFNDVLDTVINGKSGQEFLDTLTPGKLKELEEALDKIVGGQDLLGKVVDKDLSNENGKVDKNLNAAVAYLLYGVLQVVNDTNPVIQNAITFYSDFSLKREDVPDYRDADPYLQNAISNLLGYVEKAYNCLNKIKEDFGIDTDIVNDLKDENKDLLDFLRGKGYPINFI